MSEVREMASSVTAAADAEADEVLKVIRDIHLPRTSPQGADPSSGDKSLARYARQPRRRLNGEASGERWREREAPRTFAA
jgi:hypothetical protein